MSSSREPPGDSPPQTAAPLRVLVVEDDVDAAHMTAKLLERYGCDAYIALVVLRRLS